MKRMILILVSMIFLGGCIFVSQSVMEQKLKGIRVGMDKSEVANELGKPIKTESILIGKQEYESWKYPVQRKWAGKVEALGDYYYEVLFLKDKVYRWDYIKTLSQPSYNYQQPDSSNAVVTSMEIIKE